MSVKALAAALSGLALSSASLPEPASEPSSYSIPIDLIHRLDCAGGSGSGARIDGYLVATVSHVASMGGCRVGGVPLEPVYNDGAIDFAVLRSPVHSSQRLPVSCDGIRRGRIYYSVGHAHGRDFVAQRMIGTDGVTRSSDSFDGTAQLRGRGFPGMSGGAVLDEDGAIVAVHVGGRRNGNAISVVRQLKDTYLCGRAA